MLQAQNGRQFNLAANAVKAFFAENGTEIKHSVALNLVARLTGHVNYEAAQASLAGTPKGVSPIVQTWRDLAHAIGTLSDEQLDMSVQVSDGCDENGNANFGAAIHLIMANDNFIAAGSACFTDNQPILVIEEMNPEYEDIDAIRCQLQFEAAVGDSSDVVKAEIERTGLDGAISSLNANYGINISVGKYLAFSEQENGYLNVDFGFVGDKDSATGFNSERDVENFLSSTPLKAVLYSTAVDIDPDA